MSDASAEAERLSNGLRQRGHAVVDVPLALLAGRVAVQQPALLICDADAEGALETLAALRDSAIDVLLIGARDGVLASRREEVAREACGTFHRPVDIYALVKKVEALIGPPSGDASAPSVPPATRSAVLLGSSRPPPPSSSPRATDDQKIPTLPPLESRPGSERPVEPPASLMPLPLDGDPSRAIGPSELSPELTELLRQAEARVDAVDAPSSQPRPEVILGEDTGEASAPLPQDVLLALEEELDDEDPPDSAESLPPDERPSATGAPDSGATPEPEPEPEFQPSRAVRAPIDPSAHVTAVGRETGTGLTDDGSDAPHSHPGGTAADKTSAELPVEGRDREAITPKPPRPASELPPATEAVSPKQEPSTNPPRLRGEPLAPAPPPEPQIRHLPSPVPEPPQPADLLPVDRGAARSLAATLPPPARNRSAAPQPDALAMPATAGAPSTASALELPDSLREGDALRALAVAIRGRYTGCLAFEVDEGIRRVVFRDGDFVTAASAVHAESLVAVLVGRGELPPDVQRQGHKLPPSGRHAGAALIAQGHLTQDQLWPVLRTHAEWIVGQIVGIERGTVRVEPEVSGRLQEEPAVFGGATGAEVLVEIVRRIVTPADATARLGGGRTILRQGAQSSLLSECALTAEEGELVGDAVGKSIDGIVAEASDPSIPAMLYALTELGVLSVGPTRLAPRTEPPEETNDELDDAAIRERIRARKALVDEGDYFAVLGVGRNATAYEIKRAYLELRREFEPSRSLTARTADLRDTVDEIVEVIEEAYDILKDTTRRERYRRAIEAAP